LHRIWLRTGNIFPGLALSRFATQSADLFISAQIPAGVTAKLRVGLVRG
jgi:hypothetical protein